MIGSIALAFAVLSAAAVPAAAQTVSYLDFGKGPAQWIMTGDEQRAWRAVKTEDQAHGFVDLFWARRDPTPGTPLNEFRNEFENRVRYADEHFKEYQRRGAMSERGRVLIALGFPTNLSETAAATSRTNIDLDADVVDISGGRQMAAKEIWQYSHDVSLKFGLPKIEVVFVHDGFQGRVRRDPLRTDFTSALPAAIQSYIVSPDLKVVPDPASSTKPIAPAAAPRQNIETQTSTDIVTKKPVPAEPQVVVAKPAGAGKLTLLRDINGLQPQSGADPFASLQSAGSFNRGDELGWAAEFCAGRVLSEVPPVKVQIRMAGGPVSRPVSLVSEAEEFVPDSIKASPGCYLVRGSLPLSDVEPGSYKLTVTITGPEEEQRYNLTREFGIE